MTKFTAQSLHEQVSRLKPTAAFSWQDYMIQQAFLTLQLLLLDKASAKRWPVWIARIRDYCIAVVGLPDTPNAATRRRR